ncbi:rhomboid family intramembrane serine protease [Alteribacter populi]|uniref:rhomboid family intramembrane serine protease n=1 Tax=Alteribacter populi TaxID=2011011 RepID=UPI000BBB40D8|nr:rhomboid family intramembrane serine protease [Alteribacter populi]
MFIRNESFQSFTRSYPVVTTIIGIHFVLFLWMNLFPFLGGDFIRNQGIGINAFIMMGEYWRLVTPIFLHVTITHVLFNSFSLFLFGPALEQMLGKTRFIAAYLLTGILANVATLLIGGVSYLPHLGASGAIFGLFGIYLYMVLYRKDLIDSANAQVVMTILIIGLIMTFVNPRINIYAHLFGLIAGAAIGPIILYKISRFAYVRRQSRPDDHEVTFDPQRWQKKSRNKQLFKKIAFISILVLAAIAFLARFL